MKRKDILVLLIPSFIFVLAWIGFGIVHNLVTPTISESLNTQISPITPSFDTKTISDIKNRQIVEPIYEIATSAANLSLSPSLPSSSSATSEENLTITNPETNQATAEATPSPAPEETSTTTENSLPQ